MTEHTWTSDDGVVNRISETDCITFTGKIMAGLLTRNIKLDGEALLGTAYEKYAEG